MTDAPVPNVPTTQQLAKDTGSALKEYFVAPLKALIPDLTPNPARCTLLGALKTEAATTVATAGLAGEAGFAAGVTVGVPAAIGTFNPEILPTAVVGGTLGGAAFGAASGAMVGAVTVEADCAAAAALEKPHQVKPRGVTGRIGTSPRTAPWHRP
jgi:hypothetical protein